MTSCSATIHNTTWAYRKYGCRCPDAVTAMRSMWADRRNRNRVPPRSLEVDEIAVERACHGEPLPLTYAERAEAVRKLTGQGHSARAISARIRLSQRTVVRYRKRLTGTDRREAA